MAKLFRSFNEDFPIDDQSRSFLRNLLNADILHKLQTHMESLANHQHVILTIDCNKGADAKDMLVYVFPVDVDDDGKKFNVVEKVFIFHYYIMQNNHRLGLYPSSYEGVSNIRYTKQVISEKVS